MAAYIGIGVTVILSMMGATWHLSSKFTSLEGKVDQNTSEIKNIKNGDLSDLKKLIKNRNSEEGEDG